MARTMKTVSSSRRADGTLTIRLDLLSIARGHRNLPRGGVHQTARRPSRALSKQKWRKEM